MKVPLFKESKPKLNSKALMSELTIPKFSLLECNFYTCRKLFPQLITVLTSNCLQE